MKRTIIQISGNMALCDDGTVFKLTNSKMVMVKAIRHEEHRNYVTGKVYHTHEKCHVPLYMIETEIKCGKQWHTLDEDEII